MTAKENEERKLKLRYNSQDHRLIKEIFPAIEQIEINYTMVHRSAFGINNYNAKATYTPSHPNIFEIDCINKECTKGYFDLTAEVSYMYRYKLAESSKTICCEGSEAPDHMYQSCGTTLNYKINISYYYSEK